MAEFTNPFRPGAGHQPPYLAGRQAEKKEFAKLLEQDIILENLVLTGLRGVGKTVLLESLKPYAVKNGWIWIGADLNETSSVTEENIATRICADLSVFSSSVVASTERSQAPGFVPEEKIVERTLTYEELKSIYLQTPGLPLDKVKTVIETTWEVLDKGHIAHGIIFAYDEAQNLSDHSEKEQFPLSLLLDAFQSIQRKGLPIILVLAGLPTLFPNLVAARTFSGVCFTLFSCKASLISEKLF